MEDDVYDFVCGCQIRCLSASDYRRWQSDFCRLHSEHSIAAALARTRLSVDAKSSRKDRLLTAARNAPHPIRRSFAEMSVKGGFDL